MQRTSLLVAFAFLSSAAFAGPVIDWNDVNGALSGTPTLSPSNLTFTDVNGIAGLDLEITIAPSTVGGALNIDATSPKPRVEGGVSMVDNSLATATSGTGNAITFEFNQPVNFVVENMAFGNFGGDEQLIVSSTVPVTGELLTPQGSESAVVGTNMVTFSGNGSNGSGASNVRWTAMGSAPATSFTVDYSRGDDVFAGSVEPFSVSVTAVPEPSGLLFLGLLAVAGGVYRRARGSLI